MKIVCDSCQAKYSISDDKIQGKAFKIRCKKCNHVIVVRPHADASPAPEVEKPKHPETQEHVVWHIVVGGSQVGPLTATEVKERLASGQLNAESLVWKEGLADWVALATIPDFADAKQGLAPESSQAPGTSTANRGRSPVAITPTSADVTPESEGDSEAEAFAAPTMISRPNAADLFASPSASPSGQPSMDPGPTPQPTTTSPFAFGQVAASEPAITKSDGPVASSSGLTGQRNENSVLFSLSNLEALAVPSQGRAPSASMTTEGSGLIDIRSMAAMTLSNSTTSDPRPSMDPLPTFSTPQFNPVAPVLLPESVNAAPKWVYPVMALIGVGVIVLGIALVKVAFAPSPGQPQPIVIQQAPPVQPAAPVAQAPAVVPSAPSAAAVAANPAAAKVEPVQPTNPPALGHQPPQGKRGSRGTGQRGRQGSPPAATGSVAAGSKEAAIKGSPVEPAPKPPVVEERPKPVEKLASLTQSDIVAAMRGIQPKIQACANQYKVPGTAMANVSVARGGRVGNVAVIGKFAGSPTGSCVEGAVKSAKFPPCEPFTFPFPFTLLPR